MPIDLKTGDVDQQRLKEEEASHWAFLYFLWLHLEMGGIGS